MLIQPLPIKILQLITLFLDSQTLPEVFIPYWDRQRTARWEETKGISFKVPVSKQGSWGPGSAAKDFRNYSFSCIFQWASTQKRHITVFITHRRLQRTNHPILCYITNWPSMENIHQVQLHACKLKARECHQTSPTIDQCRSWYKRSLCSTRSEKYGYTFNT